MKTVKNMSNEKDLPYLQQQTGLFSDRIDKYKNNWGMLVKIACLYTNYCLSLFIMKMHLLVQLCKQKHTETSIWKQCDFPLWQNFYKLRCYEPDTALYPFLTSKFYYRGSISFT